MNKIFIILIAVLFIACNEENKSAEQISSRQQLIGEWNNLYLKVNINSKNNSDSNEVIEVDRPQWKEKLKIKPIRSFFREDSTWNSAHYNLKDSLVFNPSGKWWIEQDSLVMLQNSPSNDTSRYSLIIKNDTASFEAMLDWDMDGKKDDLYFGKQIRIKK